MKVRYLFAGACAIFCGCFFASSVFAVTYSKDVEVKFNFNSNITIDIENADIEILDLTPGQQKDSNIVDITIGTNNVAGYTVSATAGNATYNNTDMTHSNGTNKFTSIAEDASEATLSTDNTWGYSTSMDSGTTWANFSGLPVYTDTAKEIARTDGPSSDLTQFKIHAKAAASQPAGDYRNVINFIVVANVPPRTIEDVIPEMTMQAMNEEVCDLVEVFDEESQTQLRDIRDDKVYWVAKLKDNHCWMTQNLDYDISTAKTLTSENTNLKTIDTETDGYYYNGYTKNNETGVISWTPSVSTFSWNGSSWDNGSTSLSDYYYPRSFDAGDFYQVGTFFYSNNCNYLTNYENCTNYFKTSEDAVNGTHGHIGNYYNRAAAVASNNTNKYINSSNDTSLNPQNSVCPANWRLPKTKQQNDTTVTGVNEFWNLVYYYNNKSTGSDNNLFAAPLYFVRAGYVDPYRNDYLYYPGYYGYYLSSTVYGSSVYTMYHYSGYINPFTSNSTNYGASMRCIAEYSVYHTISFEPNGATNTMPSQKIKGGTAENLNANTLVWEGRAFTGWNTEPDGSGEAYANGASFSAPASESGSASALYAQWRRTGNINIVFDKNDPDATGTMAEQSIPYGSTGTLYTNAFSKPDSTFFGWNTETDGSGISYEEGSDITIDALEPADSITLYAIWLDHDDPLYDVVEIPTGSTPKGITIKRAYEIAYVGKKNKGMWEKDEGDRDNDGDTDEYFRVRGTRYNGNYDVRWAMQDMTSKICKSVTVMHSDYKALDIRDFKLYHITKLRDGKCWMTQNLDLDLDNTKTYTHADTDIGWGDDDPTNTTWTPNYTTLTMSNVDTSTGYIYGLIDTNTMDKTRQAITSSKSFDPGGWYAKMNSMTSSELDQICNSESTTPECNFLLDADESTERIYSKQMYSDNKEHGHVGNYYGPNVAFAQDQSEYLSITDVYNMFPDHVYHPGKSICPAGWRLPHGSATKEENEYYDLGVKYNQINNFGNPQLAPLYMNTTGIIGSKCVGKYPNNTCYGGLAWSGYYGVYLAEGKGTSSSMFGLHTFRSFAFFSGYGEYFGHSIRCVAR